MQIRRCPATVSTALPKGGASRSTWRAGAPIPSEDDGGARSGSRATGPTLTLGLTEGHLVNTTIHGRAAAFLLMLVTATLATVALAAPAQATAYRYWSYWQGASGTWVAAQTGPGDYTLVDEDVQGWRFAITSDNPAAPPDNAPDFAALCPDLAAAGATEGDVRLAVVLGRADPAGRRGLVRDRP